MVVRDPWEICVETDELGEHTISSGPLGMKASKSPVPFKATIAICPETITD